MLSWTYIIEYVHFFLTLRLGMLFMQLIDDMCLKGQFLPCRKNQRILVVPVRNTGGSRSIPEALKENVRVQGSNGREHLVC